MSRKIFNNKNQKRISILLVLVMIISSICITKVWAEDTVTIAVKSCPNIDIVLTLGDTETDVKTFKEDLFEKLNNNGIDTSQINIETIETVSSNLNDTPATEILDTWYNYPNLGGHFAAGWFVNSNNGLTTKENVNWTGFLNNDEGAYETKNIEVSFDLTFSDSHSDPQGWTFCSNKDGNNYSFYALEINHKYGYANLACITNWTPSLSSSTHGGPLYHGAINGQDGSYDGNQKVLSSSLQGATGYHVGRGSIAVNASKYHVNIKKNNSNIKVYVDNNLVINVNDNTLTKGTYGPYTVSQYNAVFNNISISKTIEKTYNDVLKQPSWRENSHHIIVNVNDVINSELNNNSSLSTILSNTINNNVHYISWGNNNTKSTEEKLIQNNNNKGLFINNTDYNTSLEKTANYIYSLLDITGDSEYAIVGQSLDIKVTPENLKTNTITDKYPNGRWYVEHDYQYYENNTGQSLYANKYMNNLELNFDKPGKYNIYFADKLIKTIYAHRMPQAGFTSTINNLQIECVSNSIDLDSNEDIGLGAGIIEEEWLYKEINDNNWTIGKPTILEENKSYIIQLKVKDTQEQWSDAYTQHISTVKQIVPPVSSFSIKNSTISKYKPLEITDLSYDPNSLELTTYYWTLKKDNAIISETNSPIINFSSYSTGNYSYTLQVENSEGLKSDKFTRSFTLTEDITPPEMIVTPASCEWTNTIANLSVLVNDDDSGMNYFRYAIDTNQNIDKNTIWGDNKTEIQNITISNEGIYYAHIQAYDIAGNVVERTVGPYRIDKTKPTINVSQNTKDWTKDECDIIVDVNDDLSDIKTFIYAVDNKIDIDNNTVWSDNVDSNEKEIKITDTGINYIHVKTIDLAENETIETFGPYNIDKIDPIIEIDKTNTDWHNNNIKININVSDEHTNISSFKYCVDKTNTIDENTNWTNTSENNKLITIKNDGIYYLHVSTLDTAGNISERTTGPYKIDKTKPNVSFSLINTNNGVKVIANSNDRNAGIKKITNLNNGEVVTFEDELKIVSMNLLSTRKNFLSLSDINTDSLNNEIITNQNTKYSFLVEDNAGNTDTFSLDLNAYKTSLTLEDTLEDTSKTDTLTKTEGTDYFEDEDTNIWQDGSIIEETRVTVNKASRFTITIPKEIILNGDNGTATYNISAEGDIAGNQAISVIPDNSFILNENGGKSTRVTITQLKNIFNYQNLNKDEYEGSLSTDNITAGIWSGKFMFNINFYSNFTNTNELLEAGIYDSNNNIIYTWQDLIDNNYIQVDNGSLKHGTNTEGLKSLTGTLVVDETVTSIDEFLLGEEYTGIKEIKIKNLNTYLNN